MEKRIDLQREEKGHEFSSVIEALEYWNKVNPTKEYCYLNSLKGEEKITFKELYEESQLQASWLREHGLKKGDRVILALPNGRSFLTSFLGTLMAGGVAVPVVTRISVFIGLNKAHEIVGHILEDCQAKFVITTPQNEKLWKSLSAQLSPNTVYFFINRT